MKVFYLLLFIFCTQLLLAQPILPTSILKSKQDEKLRLLKNIDVAFKLPITDTTYTRYQSAFWAMMYLEHKPNLALPKIKKALENFTNYDNGFQNALLEVAYSQYPKTFEKEIFSLIKDTSITAKQFAVCFAYLWRVNPKSIQLESAYKKRDAYVFSKENKIWYTEEERIELKDKIYFKAFERKFLEEKTIHPLKVKQYYDRTLMIDFLKNKNIIYSFQNKNRTYPGLAIIKDSLGNYLKYKDTVFYSQQLARAITNLPYYISNGNTPQGIYKISGFGISNNSHIGPTSNFQLCMPYECDVQEFFNYSIKDTSWQTNKVDSLMRIINTEFFNSSWESSIAGKLGRYEIIAHGTTVNNEYYKGKPYYGFTPTMGCLQAKEIWDYKTGQRLYSDQQKLIDAYKSIGAEKGYLIVLDIIDAPRAVNINDFKKLLK